MNFEFTENGWQDFEYWIDHDSDIVDKIRDLLKDISRNPFYGMGKPEPLKFALKGYWSRRITGDTAWFTKLKAIKG